MKITYNIPRCGNLTAQLYPNALKLYDLLDHYKHIDRLKKVNQLGRLRDIYQGAHHTRFEYVFLQLALITELCTNNRADFGFTSSRRFCGRINSEIGNPSLGDLLQCLVILSNSGYMHGTLSASRAWLSVLKNDEDVRQIFRRNMVSEDRAFFDSTLKSFNYYDFKYIVSLFFLQRSKRFDHGRGTAISDFGSDVIRMYMKSTKDIQIETWKSLYRTIRKISFITLDSLYAPVPFNLELSSIMLNFEELYETLFIKNATYNLALNSLEQALQSSVYLSSDACLTTSKATAEIRKELNTRISKGNLTATRINNLLTEDLNVKSSVNWTRERKLILTYSFNRKQDQPPAAIFNPAKWESDTENKINSSQVIAGLLLNGTGNTIKLSFGLKSTSPVENQKATLKIITEAIKFRSQFNSNYINSSDLNNQNEMVKMLLKSIFGWETRSILSNSVVGKSATIFSKGRASFISKLDEYIDNGAGVLEDSEIHELNAIRRFVENRAWAGLTFGYVGNMRLFLSGSNNIAAEFDGIIVLPTINPSNPFIYLIEAKNTANGMGHTVAINQIRNRLDDLLSDHLSYTPHPIDNLGAYAAIQLS
ncbi:hypothetical protein [Marivirga harenae]|uniref:hypothetical protein n=1 Tax=Marivirga harenae TaxID=2010992 RepID=UPI0026DF60DE|nr:hypothetical protein [Marivirga harenae]WKV12201.1 hypothetical protein Q3Y49_18550 [Marivirga harenae]